MFPSSWPEDLDDAHCTLLYLGDMVEATFSKEDLEIVIKRLNTKAPGEVAITGLDLFGPEKNVLVATLDPKKLQPIRESFERTLAKINIFNASQYKDYNPHVTIAEDFSGTLEDAKKDVKLPQTVVLGPPVLWWGNEK
jgi:2'-5' RNA ligase